MCSMLEQKMNAVACAMTSVGCGSRQKCAAANVHHAPRIQIPAAVQLIKRVYDSLSGGRRAWGVQAQADRRDDGLQAARGVGVLWHRAQRWGWPGRKAGYHNRQRADRVNVCTGAPRVRFRHSRIGVVHAEFRTVEVHALEVIVSARFWPSRLGVRQDALFCLAVLAGFLASRRALARR